MRFEQFFSTPRQNVGRRKAPAGRDMGVVPSQPRCAVNETPAKAPAPSKNEAWNVLVVDDEEDVHAVTRLALKKAHWRRTPFRLTHAKTAAEAREILSKPGADFHVAIIDVVMETK